MAQPQHTHLPDKLESVQTHGRKKKSTAVALVTKGTGMIRVNGVPLHLVEPQPLRTKLFEPILLLG
jgi:small subunit ribosomal protein S16e